MAKRSKQRTDRRATKIDPAPSFALATFSQIQGIPQQHALSAAACLYLMLPDEVRGIVHNGYACWLDATGLRTVDGKKLKEPEQGDYAFSAPVWTGCWKPTREDLSRFGPLSLTFPDSDDRRLALLVAIANAILEYARGSAFNCWARLPSASSFLVSTGKFTRAEAEAYLDQITSGDLTIDELDAKASEFKRPGKGRKRR